MLIFRRKDAGEKDLLRWPARGGGAICSMFASSLALRRLPPAATMLCRFATIALFSSLRLLRHAPCLRHFAPPLASCMPTCRYADAATRTYHILPRLPLIRPPRPRRLRRLTRNIPPAHATIDFRQPPRHAMPRRYATLCVRRVQSAPAGMARQREVAAASHAAPALHAGICLHQARATLRPLRSAVTARMPACASESCALAPSCSARRLLRFTPQALLRFC